MQEKTLTGIFEEAVVAQGSKSEHSSIVLTTDEGQHVKIRLRGKNAFESGYLAPYLNKRASVTGIELGGATLLIPSLDKIQLIP